MRATTPMTREVIVIPPELKLNSAWSIMRREHIRHLPVVRAGALIGMLSDRDVLARATVSSKDGAVHVPGDVTVGEAMTATPLKTCEASTDVADLAKMMTEAKIDAIPVVRGLHLLGLVTSTDLLELLIHRDQARPLPFEYRLIEDSRVDT